MMIKAKANFFQKNNKLYFSRSNESRMYFFRQLKYQQVLSEINHMISLFNIIFEMVIPMNIKAVKELKILQFILLLIAHTSLKVYSSLTIAQNIILCKNFWHEITRPGSSTPSTLERTTLP